MVPVGILQPQPAAAAADGHAVRFDGGGWGHGTGTSQYGARGQADAGRSAGEILTYYYRGTSVQPMAMRPGIPPVE